MIIVPKKDPRAANSLSSESIDSPSPQITTSLQTTDPGSLPSICNKSSMICLDLLEGKCIYESIHVFVENKTCTTLICSVVEICCYSFTLIVPYKVLVDRKSPSRLLLSSKPKRHKFYTQASLANWLKYKRKI